MESISLDGVRKLMKECDASGNYLPHTIRAVTLDISRKTGGQRITYKNAILVSENPSLIKIKAKGSDQIRAINPLLMTHIDEREITI